MASDFRGLEITGADEATAAAVCQFQWDFHGFYDEAGAILELAEAVPDCVTAQVYAAALHVYAQEESALSAGARPLLDRALAATGATRGSFAARAGRLGRAATKAPAVRANERERLLVTAVDAWARADYDAASTAFEALLERWPQDTTAVKFAEFVFFEAPDPARHLRLMEAVAPANRDLASFEAMRAFAHELNGRYDEAQAIAEAALVLESDTPWADHALGHVYLNTVRLDEGLSVLGALAPGWATHGVGIRVHNTWHLALLHLAGLHVDETFALYRDAIAGKDPGSAFEHTDALSLLWRLELCGVEVDPDLYRPVLPFALERVGDRVVPLLNALYVFALVRCGETAAARAAVAALRSATASRREPWHTAVSVLAGVEAFASGDYARATEAFAQVSGRLACAGGSDAQNDLLAQTELVALVRAGERAEARALFDRRVAGRPPTAQELSWLEPG